MTGILRATILGCGSSGGVPRANGDWGLCDPANPKNRRRRCALLVEQAASVDTLNDGDAVTRVIVDVAPDFREQMLSAQVRRIDGVLLTHDHADQTHGMDDLRAFALSQRARIPVWMDEATADTVLTRFGYAYNAKLGSPYPSILDRRELPQLGQEFSVDGAGGAITIKAFDQEHGSIRSVGFRFGPLAYSADISALPDDSAKTLDGVGCWIVDSLREEQHPTHFSVPDALASLERVNAAQGVLTNLHITLDHKALSAKLPSHVRCAHDGMQILWNGAEFAYS